MGTKLRKVRVEAHDAYRIDRVNADRTVSEWFYGIEFGSRAEANAYIKGRKSRGKLVVKKYHVEAHDSWVGTIRI